jgi:hypothetical protein
MIRHPAISPAFQLSIASTGRVFGLDSGINLNVGYRRQEIKRRSRSLPLVEASTFKTEEESA